MFHGSLPIDCFGFRLPNGMRMLDQKQIILDTESILAERRLATLCVFNELSRFITTPELFIEIKFKRSHGRLRIHIDGQSASA